MPPRDSARVAERVSSALSPLPLPLVLQIFSSLPVDERARAACVCRGWCHVLLERSLWTRLNLSPSSGVRVRVTDAVLASAAAKARGQLAALDVSGCRGVAFEAVLVAVRANAGALRELRVGVHDGGLPQTLDSGRVVRLLLAAPQLTACHADVMGMTSAADARRMLRNEAPFEVLHLRTVRVEYRAYAAGPHVDAVPDLAAHASLKRVTLSSALLHTLTAMDAVVDAALSRQLISLRLWHCRLVPASAPALVRLLGSGTLTELAIIQQFQLLDGPTAALLGDALRSNSTLTSLHFRIMFWQDAVALLGALTGHRSLRTLNVSDTALEVGLAVGGALGALIAANAPALKEIDLARSRMSHAALRPLLEALPANTHLRTLNISFNRMSDEFARDVLLPSVRANTSLRKLAAYVNGGWEGGSAFANEAMALVAARGGAAGAAE
jgi:hypothetical protein